MVCGITAYFTPVHGIYIHAAYVYIYAVYVVVCGIVVYYVLTYYRVVLPLSLLFGGQYSN